MSKHIPYPTYTDIEHVLDLYAEGKSAKEVATQVGKTYTSVYYLIWQYETWKKDKNTGYVTDRLRNMFVLYAERKSVTSDSYIPVSPGVERTEAKQTDDKAIMEAEQKLKEALLSLADIIVAQKYKKEIDILKQENKRIHGVLEKLQAESIVGAMRKHFIEN